MIISDLLAQKSSTDIKTIRPDSSLLQMATILRDDNIGVLIVLDDKGGIAGVASERDLARALVSFPDDIATRLVSEIMTTRVITCELADKVVDVLDMMNKCGIRHIPALKDGKLKAILSIREFNMAYQRLQDQARTDYLTGLANRRHFMEIFEREINRRSRFNTPLSIIAIDIDRFKRINDKYGHHVGDQVICVLADILKSKCRIYDAASRLGGEEYAVICPNTNLAGALILAERLIDEIRKQTVITEAGVVQFTASFGVYETTEEGEKIKVVLHNVDKLLYQAKRNGRDRIVSGNSTTGSHDVRCADSASKRAPVVKTTVR